MKLESKERQEEEKREKNKKKENDEREMQLNAERRGEKRTVHGVSACTHGKNGIARCENSRRCCASMAQFVRPPHDESNFSVRDANDPSFHSPPDPCLCS